MMMMTTIAISVRLRASLGGTAQNSNTRKNDYAEAGASTSQVGLHVIKFIRRSRVRAIFINLFNVIAGCLPAGELSMYMH